MRRVRGAVLLVLTLLVAGCGGEAEAPPRAGVTEAPDVPEMAGTWEKLPAAPLSPRGGAQAVWTGSEVVFWGGGAVDPNAEPCPPAADCLPPPSGPEAEEVAAYDPAAGMWRRLTGTPPSYGRAFSAQGKVMDQLFSYDPATGVTTTHGADLLVYAQAQVIGSDLVVVGWDYSRGERSGVGQVVAASLDLTAAQAQWRYVEWPFPPPGDESLQTATDGTELLVLSSASNPEVCDGAASCQRFLRFAPASGTWTDLGVSAEPLQQLGSAGGLSYGFVYGEASSKVVAVSTVDGSLTSLGNFDTYGSLLISATGRLALDDGRHLNVLAGDGAWERLPAVPGDPVSPAVVWAGDDLVVWGGSATEGEPDTRNSADGWIFRPTP